jgi:hypothetical protein
MRGSTYEKTLNPYQSQQVTYLIRIRHCDPLTTDLIFIRAIGNKLGVAGSKMTLIIGHGVILTPFEYQPIACNVLSSLLFGGGNY